jgi:hypothetical protein
MPADGQLLGVRVSEPKVVNAAEIMRWARSHRESRMMTGTGIGCFSRGGRQVIMGFPGSPAERAGIGLDPVVVLALDGVPVTTRTPVTHAALHRPWPLRVTYRTLEGKPRTVVLNHETFISTNPLPEVHHGQEAALIFLTHGKTAALIESERRRTGFVDSKPSAGRQMKIAGQEVYLSGRAGSPTASWASGRTQFTVENSQGALSIAEVEELIRSLHPSES